MRLRDLFSFMHTFSECEKKFGDRMLFIQDGWNTTKIEKLRKTYSILLYMPSKFWSNNCHELSHELTA
jgi:hypothetical protein